MKTPALFRPLSGALLMMGILAAPAWADRTIVYGSTLEAVNVTSDGAPLDDSFIFELGTFTGNFLPTLTNTSEWLAHWAPAPNSSDSEYSGATTYYSTEQVPFLGGGPANAFQGFVALNTNDDAFAPGLQGYFWGFDEREGVAAAEWVLLSNTAWVIPTVMPGEIEFSSDLEWLTSDTGTYSITGSVNPYFNPDAPVTEQPAHLVSSLVAIPEPKGLLFVLPVALLLRRRRTPSCLTLS